MIISEFESDDRQKTAIVFKRENSFRVSTYDVYFERQTEKFFDNLEEAENFAEDYVLGMNNGT